MLRMCVLAGSAVVLSSSVFAQEATPTYKADVPAEIVTPDTVQTGIGDLTFQDGAPSPDTVSMIYDYLDRARGMEAFLAGMPAASVHAACKGLASVGIEANRALGITEDLMDARSLFLTPNTTTVYAFTCLDLSVGPIVFEVPPEVLGPVDDAYFRFVTDLGLTGPDQGKGGKYLFVPPGFTGTLPDEGYFVVHSPTYGNIAFFRGFVKDGDVKATVADLKTARIYPLAEAENPPEIKFVNTSGLKFNTVHANNDEFFEELDEVVQKEPADFVSAETAGLFAAIGIKKGQPFAPDARMSALLTEGVALGNAAARAIVFAPRDLRATLYTDRQWITGFIGGSYEFLDNGERMLDARTLFHYYATGITPAMAMAKPGSGSAYAAAFRDADGAYLDGAKTYSITLPAPIPAANFWSFVVYDNQTRSLLETDQKLAGLDSLKKDLQANDDGSVTVWFGPTAPAGHETNWIQTMPGKGWNVLLRLYAPLEPWFDKSWKPGDFELVKD